MLRLKKREGLRPRSNCQNEWNRCRHSNKFGNRADNTNLKWSKFEIIKTQKGRRDWIRT